MTTPKKVVLFVVAFCILLFSILKELEREEGHVRDRQPGLIDECRRMGGEAILSYDATYRFFVVTGCKVPR